MMLAASQRQFNFWFISKPKAISQSSVRRIPIFRKKGTEVSSHSWGK